MSSNIVYDNDVSEEDTGDTPNIEASLKQPSPSGAFKTFAPPSREESPKAGAFSYKPKSSGAFKTFAPPSREESPYSSEKSQVDPESPANIFTSFSKQSPTGFGPTDGSGPSYSKPTHIQNMNGHEIPADGAVMVTSSVVDLLAMCFRKISLTKEVCKYTIPLNLGHDDDVFQELRWNHCAKIFSVSRSLCIL